MLFYRLSVSTDLRYDAERDLRDIGAKNIKVYTWIVLSLSELLIKIVMYTLYHPLINKYSGAILSY